ncbi:hypothetical protein PY365_29185 [Roseiarcaceae bacterium H3SJ34-1]|uniref:hypothetical protein n=1 Tax=Terripilifer ovatus TaxID=3032367 RepID=UPI003AB922B1|nr:hypothetical protein [Roseiarcaceae bacterium H3SJ34-1]
MTFAAALSACWLSAMAGPNTVTDQASGAMIEPPAGIVVTAGTEIPEWDFKAAPAMTDRIPAVGERGILCSLTFSIAPRYGDKVTSSYLKATVDAHMQAQGAQGPPSTIVEANGRFIMLSRWTPTQGQDAGNVIFMYHAQTNSTYAYLSCVARVHDADAMQPIFRSIWDGIRLPD